MRKPRADPEFHSDAVSAARQGDGFPREAFAHLAALEERHAWFRARSRLIVWALEHYFPHAQRLLEVGCGTGVVLKAIHRRFPDMELVGADLAPEALRIAETRVTAKFIQVDTQEMPFEGDFDVVCAFDVLEHVDSDRAALTELARATRSGGGLLVTVPQYQWLWSAADEYGRHRRRYAKGEIEDKIAMAGFTLVRSTAWVCTLLPLVALSRFRDRRAGDQFDPCRELRPSNFVNRSLEIVLEAERIAIQRGLTLPFGTSRLLVARKR
jgi:ubiquinone/menaquinone biosynthesis C-methylase UbiE